MRMESDHARFKKIVKGKIRQDFKKYITNGEMIGRVGGKHVSIPVPGINIPKFVFDNEQRKGVGQGDGEEGDEIGKDGEPGSGKAGEGLGQHVLEVDVELDELAAMLGEELELPNIEPKGTKNVKSKKDKYTSIRSVGPESLRHFKRTFKQALMREISSGTYNFEDPIVTPIKPDTRYRASKTTDEPVANAVIIYMMDVSGSMSDSQKEIVRIQAFWIDTWLRHQYDNIESRYIIHDSVAKEVDRETFFHTRESGGTKISSALEECLKIIQADYSPEDWNIYPFHFSDGDNWSRDDDERCISLLKEEILPIVNMFCYGQVLGVYGYGDFKRVLDNQFGENENLITSEIENKDAIVESIKDFFVQGN